MLRSNGRCIICGLVGIVNREIVKYQSDKLIKAFNQMLYCDTLRGAHGTGILAVKSNGNQTIFKKALPASDFIDLSKYKEIVSADNEFLCGHNRFATQGGHTAENAHPFHHGKTTMFHNGTLDTWKWMAKDKSFAVDSECLTYAFSKSEDTIKTLEEIDGAFSLVWYDMVSKSLNFARNKERPMFFGTIKKSNSFLYASEAGLIEWIASRNDIELNEVISTNIGELIVIPLDRNEDCKSLSFTPRKINTWEKYYNRGSYRSVSEPAPTPFKLKNKDMLGTEIIVKGKSWAPYTANNNSMISYGKLDSLYKGLDLVKVSSILLDDSIKLINASIVVRVSAVLDDSFLATFVRVAKEEDILKAERSKSVVPWKLKNLKLLSDDKAKHCSVCYDAIPVNLNKNHRSYDGELLCNDCAETYEQYLA